MTPLPCACVERTGGADSTQDTCAVILAAGSGARFGDARGKQFVDLLGLPLMAWSILAFDSAPSVSHLVVVCPANREREVATDVLARLELRRGVTLVPGGRERQDSVLRGIMAAPEELPLVAIHDGARPLIEVEAIERCLDVVRSTEGLDGALCAARVTDTLKVVDACGNVMATPDRTSYWSAQTPQAFVRSRLLAAHEQALLQGFLGTDDASLVERAGGLVRVVETSHDNIKVTVPEDLSIAEATLRARMGIL